MGVFIPNPLFEAALLRSSGVKDALDEIAQEGAHRYAESVPIDTGDLQESVFGDVALTPEGYKGRIGARDPVAGLVEFGTFEHAPDASLRRALESMGLEFEVHEEKY